MRMTLVVALLLVAGCVPAYVPKPAPLQESRPSIDVVEGGLSGWSDLPIGFYRIPDSQVVMSGHQSREESSFFLFDMIGVMAQARDAPAEAEAAVRDVENALRLRVAPLLREVVADSVAGDERLSSHYDASSGSASLIGPVLELDAALIMSLEGDDQYRAYAVVKASLKETPTGSPLWKTRYFASSGQSRGLFGEDGWAAQHGAFLRSYAVAELERLADLVLTDVAAPYPRDDAAIVTVESHFPYLRRQLQTRGYLLEETDHRIVIQSQMHPSMAHAGVYVLDKSLTSWRPAASGDSVFKVIDMGR
jgi:hypothetical protein